MPDPKDENGEGFLQGIAYAMEQRDVPEGEGDGFLMVLSGSDAWSETLWRVETEDREHQFGEQVDLPAGRYNLVFSALGDVKPPRPMGGVQVRPGIGTIIIVRYDEARSPV
jgi:hypothetical protein